MNPVSMQALPAFYAGTKDLDGFEGGKSVFGREVVLDADGPFGEECHEGGAVRDGLIRRDGELAPQSSCGFDAVGGVGRATQDLDVRCSPKSPAPFR